MSGTSMDAIDTAIVSFANPLPELVSYRQFPIDETLKASVRQLNSSSSIKEITELDARMGHLFADSVLKILNLSDIKASEIVAIGNHGQTVLHLPDATYPRTLQIGDPNIIAHKTGITTVSDFRRMDIADGGQGAPLAPAFHAEIFRTAGTARIILNIGGIANITRLPGDPQEAIAGFDTGPGNGLLDDWNQLHNQTEMDRDSHWAATGKIDQDLLTLFLSDPYFELAPPKSSGRDYFNLTWLNDQLDKIQKKLSPQDIQATLLQLSVLTIAQAILRHAPNTQEIYMCGGGSHNMGMVAALAGLVPNISLTDTGALGLDPDAIEALTFAWLAKQTMEHKTSNNIAVTGANSAQILGGIYQSARTNA